MRRLMLVILALAASGETWGQQPVVRAEVTPERAVSTELLLWDESEMLFGPKIHLQERLEKKALEQVGKLHKALR